MWTERHFWCSINTCTNKTNVFFLWATATTILFWSSLHWTTPFLFFRNSYPTDNYNNHKNWVNFCKYFQMYSNFHKIIHYTHTLCWNVYDVYYENSFYKWHFLKVTRPTHHSKHWELKSEWFKKQLFLNDLKCHTRISENDAIKKHWKVFDFSCVCWHWWMRQYLNI